MSKVIDSLARLRHHQSKNRDDHARHRRDGWFDESDNWHDAESDSAANVTDEIAR